MKPKILGLEKIFLGLHRRWREQAGRWPVKSCFEPQIRQTGRGDKVISFSLFGSDPRYFIGLARIVDSYRRLLPDYTPRFYVAADLPLEVKKRLIDSGSEVITMKGGGVNQDYRMWRFLATEDVDLKRVLVRDSDSLPSRRELRLVREWERSGKQFHIIRDHYSHSARVMAGMWGAVPKQNLVTAHLSHLWKLKKTIDRDQKFLEKFIHPVMRDSVLVNDVIHRFIDETPSLVPIDKKYFSFIGEVSYPSNVLEQGRRDYRKLVLERQEIWD